MPHNTLFILRRRSDNGGWVVGRCYYLDTRQHISYISQGQFSGIRRHLSICLRPTQRVGGFVVLPEPAWGCPQHTAAPPGGRPPAAES